MAGGSSEVSQIVRLNGTQYRSELGKIQGETRSSLQKMMRDLTDAGKSWGDFSNYVKKQACSIIESVEEAGKSFAKNLGRGALAGGALAGIEALRGGIREAVKTGLSFDDALARVSSRADMSARQVAKLKQEFFELGKTGAQLDSIPAAFDAIYGATGNINQSKSVMEPIAKAAAMGDGDASKVAEFVKDRLKGEGKDINKSNVQELLQSLVLAQRGGEFNSLSDAMQGMSGVNAAAQKRAGLSDREMAGILAGSTRAGADKATGLAGAQALIHMSQQGFGGGAALAGMLGVGSFMNGGKFDASTLTRASANQKRSGRSDSESVALFQGAGLSEVESTGLLAILKNVEKFQDGIKKVAADTKTFDQSFAEVTDTLSHRLEQLKNATVSGFNDIFSPMMGPAKQAAGGHIGDAISGLPRMVGGMASGVAEHPMLAGGALLATAAGGAILKKFGIGGGLAEGLAKGSALSKMGVQPVYVTNANEIAQSGASGDFMKKMSEMAMGTGSAATGIGGMAKIAGVLGVGGAGIAAASVLSDIGGSPQVPGADPRVNRMKANREAAEARGESPDLISAIFKLIDEVRSGYKDASNLKIEVDSKDPAYMARPKKTDNSRDPRGL